LTPTRDSPSVRLRSHVLTSTELAEQTKRATQVHSQLAVLPFAKPLLNPGLARRRLIAFRVGHRDRLPTTRTANDWLLVLSLGLHFESGLRFPLRDDQLVIVLVEPQHRILICRFHQKPVLFSAR
jgi:hypothetical protein